MKAGIYIRVSSDRQAKEGESLAEQEATLQAYCNFRDIAIASIYKEEGRSGKDTNRPQFQRMIKDCQLGKIDTVIVKKVDRLSRSLIDFEKTIKFFEDNNVNLISLNENFDTSTAIGRAVIRIILTFAQLEREQTSERTVDVMKFRAEQGQWNGGYPPLGYDYDKELGLIINTEEAKIVRIIFDKYIELASYRKVAEFLNAAGHRTKKFTNRIGQETGGEKFIDTSIATILKNPIYIGQIRYKGEVYQGKHTAVIDRDNFIATQEIIKRNGERKTSVMKANKHNFLLEGLVKCGDCGAMMSPKWCLSRSRQRYFYYNCTNAEHSGGDVCLNKSIGASVLEQFVLSRVREIAGSEDRLQQVINYNTQAIQAEIKKLDSERLILKMKLKEIEDKATGLVNKISELPELSGLSFVKEELEKLEKDKVSVKQEIDNLVLTINQLNNRIISKDIIRESFQSFTNIYGKLSNELKRYLIKLLIKEITFNKTSITINFFETKDITEVISAGAAGGRFAATMDWLRNSNTKPIYTSRLCINTYSGNRGKVLYKILMN